jgi:hypothetical protein
MLTSCCCSRWRLWRNSVCARVVEWVAEIGEIRSVSSGFAEVGKEIAQIREKYTQIGEKVA